MICIQEQEPCAIYCQKAKYVIGIESVQEAIDAAKEHAKPQWFG